MSINETNPHRAAGLQAAKTRHDRELAMIKGSEMYPIICDLTRIALDPRVAEKREVCDAVWRARLLAVQRAIEKSKVAPQA